MLIIILVDRPANPRISAYHLNGGDYPQDAHDLTPIFVTPLHLTNGSERGSQLNLLELSNSLDRFYSTLVTCHLSLDIALSLSFCATLNCNHKVTRTIIPGRPELIHQYSRIGFQ